jgi:hypothetical protein
MRSLLEWLSDQRSGVAIGLAVLMLAVTLVMRYGFDLWWPAGIALATIFGFVGLISGSQK